MGNTKLESNSSASHSRRLTQNFSVFSKQILRYANRGVPRVEFLREVSKMLLEFTGCDAIELRLNDGDLHYCWRASLLPKESYNLELTSYAQSENGKVIPCLEDSSTVEKICNVLFLDRTDSPSTCFTKNGSFWTGDTTKVLSLSKGNDREAIESKLDVDGDYKSLAMIPFVVDENNVGLLKLKSKHRYFFTVQEIELYESVAQTLGGAVTDRRAQAALRERIKELTCLYSIAQVVQQPDVSIDEIVQNVVELLPPAFQYPETAKARIILDEKEHKTSGFKKSKWALRTDIVVGSRNRGLIEVVYAKKRSEIKEALFLKEEKNLIDTVARQVALIIERRQTNDEKMRLQEQLRHADRLATIGQLAAGVAHELNEPLGNILGFAQLIKKDSNLSNQVEQDIERIIRASLHAREVVKKLLIFARQVPTHKVETDLNKVVEDGLYFLESRCSKQGIKLMRCLSPGLPKIVADPSQLNQVLVNLVVNSLQAMPKGGKLKIKTRALKDGVLLIVEDTGVGMNEDVLNQAFVPFFTTKDVGQGTGLGLPVVHGIVTSHGGKINVKSGVGKGTRFMISLPYNGAQKEVGYGIQE